MFWITLLLFSLTYLALAVGRIPGFSIDRPGIAFVGATAMLASGQLTLQQAVDPRCINYEAILLLFGMMVVVAMLRISGFLDRFIHLCLSRIRSPKELLAITIFLSGILSAFLVNDIVCIALTPLILQLARRLNYDPIPHMLGLATASNIGSTGAITGNPQNMIIGTLSKISYFRFSSKLFPIAILGLVIAYLLLAWIYRKELVGSPRPEEETTSPDRGVRSRAHTALQIKTGIVTLLAITGFFVLPSEYLPVTAMAAASVLLLGRVNPEKVYRLIDWTLVMLFAGLFVIVYGFRLHVVEHWRIQEWKWLLDRPIDGLSCVSVILSNLVSNVPAVLLFQPIVEAMARENQETAWLALAMSSTLAGNLTILGSVANLIVVEIARREGVKITFMSYCKVGIPLTLITLMLGVAWLSFLRY